MYQFAFLIRCIDNYLLYQRQNYQLVFFSYYILTLYNHINNVVR